MKILIKFLPIFFIVGVFSFSLNAQERVHIKKSEFKNAGEKSENNEAEFQKAWKNIKSANHLFSQNKKGSYRKAGELYKKATEYNSNNPELNLLVGLSYMNSYPQDAALEYVEKAVSEKENVHKKAKYFLAEAYQYAGKFQQAKSAYEEYSGSLSGSNTKLQAEINKRIKDCESGINLSKTRNIALVENAGDINSEYDDYSPIVSHSGDTIYFTSKRAHKKAGIDILDDEYYEDVYIATKTGKKWSEAINLGKPVNQKLHDAVAGMNYATGQLMVYKSDKKQGGLYTATFKDDKWKSIKSFTGKVNNKKSHESYVCFNQDGTKMFFISSTNRKSQGGKDIFMSTLKKGTKNSWTKPVNLGSTINTPYDEISVSISPDEKTLYFASNGHNTMGGFDIFKSVWKDGQWSEPENMGAPINSPVDDIYFTVLSNGKDAYYASSRNGGKGGFDIYHAVIIGKSKPVMLSHRQNIFAGLEDVETIMEEPVTIKYTKTTVVRGMISDYNTNNALVATIELVDNKTGKKLSSTKSKKGVGEYSVALPSGKNYGFSVTAPGYMFHSENFNIPKTNKYEEIVKNIALQPMTAGSKIILYNTFFSSGKSTLRPESFSELNRVAKMFKQYPKLVLEISGHTDKRGSLYVNKRLSKARAQAVVDYLIQQGVKPQNLKAVGYYYKYPVASNRTKEGRQQNRRVEAKIISN